MSTCRTGQPRSSPGGPVGRSDRRDGAAAHGVAAGSAAGCPAGTGSAALREQVQLGRDVAERRSFGQGPLERQQRGRGAGLGVEHGAGDEVGDDAHAVDLLDDEPGADDERAQLRRCRSGGARRRPGPSGRPGR